MTRTEILELAKHADIQDAWFRTPHPGVVFQLEHFANLVAAKEREGCAAACDNEKWDHQTRANSIRFIDTYNGACDDCIEAIRSRT